MHLDLMTEETVLELLDCTRNDLDRLVSNCMLSKLILGGRVRYQRGEVEYLSEAWEVKPLMSRKT